MSAFDLIRQLANGLGALNSLLGGKVDKPKVSNKISRYRLSNKKDNKGGYVR